MNTWIRRTLQVGLISTGFVMVGAAAHADTTVNHGIGNGNAVVVPIQLPLNVSGNAIGVLGDARAASRGGSVAHLESALGSRSDGTTVNRGILNGNLVYVPIQAPINVCGNAVAVLGHAEAACRGGAVASNSHGDRGRHGDRDRRSARANRRHGGDVTVNHGILNGNAVIVPIQLPVNVCGNAVAAFGHASAACEGGAAAHLGRRHSASRNDHAAVSRTLNNAGWEGNSMNDGPWTGHNRSNGWNREDRNHGWNGHRGEGWLNDGCCDERGGRGRGRGHDVTINHGILNGNLIAIPVQVPINVCGNALALAGHAEAACEGGAVARHTRSARDEDGDVTINHGILNGNHAFIPVQIPVNVSGNALALFGHAFAASRGGALAWL